MLTIKYCEYTKLKKNKFKVLMESDNMLQIACGGMHLVIIEDSIFGSKLHVWGQLNSKKYVFDDKIKMRKSIFLITGKIKQVTCNWKSSVFLRDNGDVFTIKYSIFHSYEQYLNKEHYWSDDNANKPVLLMNDPNIKKIVSGTGHTFILKYNGDLWGFGDNHKHQLFNNDKQKVHVLKMIMKDVDQIYCGGSFSLVLKDNKLMMLGNIYTDNEKELLLNHPIISNINHLSDIKQISCGTHHVMILKNNGELIGYGDNNCGQLGLNEKQYLILPTLLMTNRNIISISCYQNNSMIYFDNGELLGFGYEFHHQSLLKSEWEVTNSTLIIKNNNMHIIKSESFERVWSHETHKTFPNTFKQKILLFVVHLKRNYVKTKIKIPKFVLFEIIKLTI